MTDVNAPPTSSAHVSTPSSEAAAWAAGFAAGTAAAAKYEIARSFNGSCQRWQAYARSIGFRCWTHVGDVGPAGMPEAELDDRATTLAASWIRLGLVR